MRPWCASISQTVQILLVASLALPVPAAHAAPICQPVMTGEPAPDCGGDTTPPDDPLPLDPGAGSPPPHNTVEHSGAAEMALANSLCARNVGVTDAEAKRWMNAADCFGNRCAGSTDLTLASGSPGYQDAQWNGLCWACRNADHFTSNPFPGWNGIGSLGGGFTGAWTPADGRQAQAALMQQALAMAQSAQTDADRKAALQVAFQACHYATDATACGHGLGNVFCDPAGANISQACRDFVSANSGRMLTLHDSLALSGIPTVCSGGTVSATASWAVDAGWTSGRTCGPALLAAGWQPSEGLALAAQERFIRHHGGGQTLSDGTQNTCYPGGTAPSNDVRNPNTTVPPCSSGECLPGHPVEPENVPSGADTAVVAQACGALLNQVCAVMPLEKKVAHKVCDRSSGTGRVIIGPCTNRVAPPLSVQYTETGYDTCDQATAAALLEPDPTGCTGLQSGGGGGSPIGLGGPAANVCNSCAMAGQECNYAVCPQGGFQYCGSCSAPMSCGSDGRCGVPSTALALACTNVTCGWDTPPGMQPVCCDESCPGSCPTYGNPDGGSGGGGGDLPADPCDTAGYWSDGNCLASSICTGKSVFLKDGTECFE